MTLKIIDRTGKFNQQQILSLAQSLMTNRAKEDGLNYGLETHGVFGVTFGLSLEHPIQVVQEGKRESHKSPLNIVIEKHYPL